MSKSDNHLTTGQTEQALESDTEKVSGIGRRELLKKYGAYSTPMIVTLLTPKTSYAHYVSGVSYSSTATCFADPGTGHSSMSMHCGINPGMMAHDITG